MREFTGYKKGVDLGGWLSQCGAGNYTEEHYSTFITEADIEKIARWGVDHVRLPVDYNVVQNEDGSFINSGFSHIDRCIDRCRHYGLKIVLDLHKASGYVFDDKTCCQFFSDEKLQDIFISLWEEFARRYGGCEDIAFELLNEITDRSTAEIWNNISERTVAAIRKIAPTVKIIIGGIFNSSIYGLTLLRPPADENIVYTFHCYSPLIFTHQAAYWVENMPLDLRVRYPMPENECKELSRTVFGRDFDGEFSGEREIDEDYFLRLFAPALEIAERYNVPLYCGEYGVIDYAAGEDTVKWFSHINAAFERCNIPRAVWTYKSMNFGLCDTHYEKFLPDIIKYL